jgi:hypothetical protein
MFTAGVFAGILVGILAADADVATACIMKRPAALCLGVSLLEWSLLLALQGPFGEAGT